MFEIVSAWLRGTHGGRYYHTALALAPRTLGETFIKGNIADWNQRNVKRWTTRNKMTLGF